MQKFPNGQAAITVLGSTDVLVKYLLRFIVLVLETISDGRFVTRDGVLDAIMLNSAESKKTKGKKKAFTLSNDLGAELI
jgi:hypothetical protein